MSEAWLEHVAAKVAPSISPDNEAYSICKFVETLALHSIATPILEFIKSIVASPADVTSRFLAAGEEFQQVQYHRSIYTAKRPSVATSKTRPLIPSFLFTAAQEMSRIVSTLESIRFFPFDCAPPLHHSPITLATQ